MFLAAFVAQIPVLLIALIACVVVIMKWKEGSRGSMWALAGFAIVVLLGILIPAVQSSVQVWIRQNPHTVEFNTQVFASLGFFWSLLRGLSYILLLVAVYAGRLQPAGTTVPPLRQG